MIVWLLLACRHAGDSEGETDPLSAPLVREEVDCAVAGPQGLAVRVERPPAPRHEAGTPVFVRVNPPGRLGFDEVYPDQAAIEAGAAVIRFLDVGTSQDGQTSGGTFDGAGASRLEALRCVLAEARRLVPEASVVVVTGFSQGGNAVMAAHDGADAVVVWEPPLVDQLVMVEPTAGGVADPTFVEGTCTLDGGCPFPGREDSLRWDESESKIFHDLDGDGVLGAEPSYRGLKDEVGGTLGFVSVELWDAIAADEEAVFGGSAPANWPSRIELVQFWAPRDATAALRDLRDGAGGRFLLVATADDHVQAVHDHERILVEALSGADWWRVNPDSAYSGTGEVPAGEAPDWEGLPEISDALLVLSAELEMADRFVHDVWDADLTAPLE